jgi:hypothetical protein
MHEDNGEQKDIAHRITILETNQSAFKEKLDFIISMLNDLKNGIAKRVETHGEDLAVIKMRCDLFDKEKLNYVSKDSIEDLQSLKKYVIGSIVMALVAILFDLIKK